MSTTTTAREPGAAPAPPPVRLGDLLLSSGVISQDQLNQALQKQRSSGHRKLLGETLLEMGFVTEEQVAETLAGSFGIPFARISPKVVDPKIVQTLSKEFLEKHTVLPMFLVQGRLTVAVHEPANVFLIEEVQRLAGCPVDVVAGTAKDIRATLQAHLPAANVFVIDDLVSGQSEQELELVERQVADIAAAANPNESPVIKLVNYIIFSAAEDGASDIHIEPSEGAMRVRYRVDGVMFEKIKPPSAMHAAVVSRIKIMANLDISERRIPQDGGITVMVNQRPIDLRVSTMPAKFGEKVVIRIIDNRNLATSLDRLGFSPDMLTLWRSLINAPNGVVLVTGPTGSGKSTTLYGTLREIANDELNVCTVEDPVEYNLAGINQFQVHEKAGFSFASALRALLRQDPDILMVGEVRDAETGRICIQAALTGHLVLSTLHTNDAPSAITRLFNIGVEPYLVAAAVRGVLAQRLVRRVCTHCREPAELTPALRAALEQIERETGVRIDSPYRGVGCDRCRGRGYSGRAGIYELFAPDDETLDMISRGATLQELRRAAKACGGYRPLRVDGLEKVKAGVTTLEELLSVAAS